MIDWRESPFKDIVQRAQLWTNNKVYYGLIDLGARIHAGETPEKTDDVKYNIIQLYKDATLLARALPSGEVFFIVTLWSYYADEPIINMTDLAKWLPIAQAQAKSGVLSPIFDVSNLAQPTKTQRSRASNWVRYNNVPIYKDPTQKNSTYANKVLRQDVIYALWQSEG